MYPSTVILCVTICTVRLNGATCHLFPQVIVESLTSVAHPKNYKRQTSFFKSCVIDKLNDAFAGNTSQFVSDCKFAATLESDLSTLLDSTDTGIDNLQSLVTTVFRKICMPECGNVAIDAYNDCGIFDFYEIFVTGVKEFTVGLCGTNENGDVCYQMYGDALHLVIDELSCDCSCQSLLSNGISQQGCCINIYHDLRADNRVFDARELYDACSIALPDDCNNSTIELSAALSTIVSFTSTLSLPLSLMFYIVLG